MTLRNAHPRAREPAQDSRLPDLRVPAYCAIRARLTRKRAAVVTQQRDQIVIPGTARRSEKHAFSRSPTKRECDRRSRIVEVDGAPNYFAQPT